MKRMFICFLFLLGSSGIACCGQFSRIELSDGSVIQGEIISLENGAYTLKTAELGELKIDASKIRNIQMPNSDAGAQGYTQVPSNADFKSEVDKVLADPQFQELTKDPDITNAAKSGDIKSLMSNDKIKNLINNPKLKEIENRLKDSKSPESSQ